MNMAVMTGPQDEAVDTKSSHASDPGDYHDVVGHTGIFVHQDQAQQVVDQTDRQLMRVHPIKFVWPQSTREIQPDILQPLPLDSVDFDYCIRL